jgi:hypothetical protein
MGVSGRGGCREVMLKQTVGNNLAGLVPRRAMETGKVLNRWKHIGSPDRSFKLNTRYRCLIEVPDPAVQFSPPHRRGPEPS